MKLCVLGCGLRTPLLLHGLLHSGLEIAEIALYDTDPGHSGIMAAIGVTMARGAGTQVAASPLEEAVTGAQFVISSVRVGDMKTRATDERLALDCGFAGQETTGPAGFAMALRTIPVALDYARTVKRLAPSAWMINFTNPAGIITQAITTHADIKAIGICDTPAELIFQISRALREPLEAVQCGYFGLNHLGWVKSVQVRGQEVLPQLLGDDRLLQALYPSHLFAPELIRALGVLPTEYLFFYYNQSAAKQNQLRAGFTRGEELQILNAKIWDALEDAVQSGNPSAALEGYKRYLNRRNFSYMKLEGAGESAFGGDDPRWDPFEGETGYHRIAVDAIRALTSDGERPLILNVQNHDAIAGLRADDVVEVPCLVNRSVVRHSDIGRIPDTVRGLLQSVKQYERLTIKAAVDRSWDSAAFALMTNPIVGDWGAARQFLAGLEHADPEHFAGFERHDLL